MNLKHSLLAIAMSTVFAGPALAADAARQAVVDALASNLVVKYEVVTNDGAGAGLDCQALGSEWASCGVAKLHLTNTGADVTSKDWSIYVSSIRRIQRVDNDQFTITHLTGDLYRLTPTEKFQGFAKDATVEVRRVADAVHQRGLKAGLWLAPFAVQKNAYLAKKASGVTFTEAVSWKQLWPTAVR
jgi:hexosaminidase